MYTSLELLIITCKINSFLVSAMRGPHSPLLPLTVTGMVQLVSS